MKECIDVNCEKSSRDEKKSDVDNIEISTENYDRIT